MSLPSIDKLSASLRLLPGVGSKSSERMAYEILKFTPDQLNNLITSLQSVRDNISICPHCGAYMENNICSYCSDSTRSKETLLVLASYKDALSFERINNMHYSYHILNGVISPSKGISASDLKLNKLYDRIGEGYTEVILALNPDIDGETTSLYLEKILSTKFPEIKISRLAYGLPMGGNLIYVDELTLTRALENRKVVKGE